MNTLCNVSHNPTGNPKSRSHEAAEADTTVYKSLGSTPDEREGKVHRDCSDYSSQMWSRSRSQWEAMIESIWPSVQDQRVQLWTSKS